MEKLISQIKEVTKNYDNQLDKLDKMIQTDDLIKVPLSELRENLFSLFLLILNDKSIKDKSLIITGLHRLLRDCQHWKVDSIKEQDQLINQLLQLIEESIFNQTESIKIDLLKVLLETSCINANSINLSNLIRIMNLGSRIIEKANQSNDISLILATYTSVSQIIENYILFFDENEHLNSVTIRNGYLECCHHDESNKSFEINDKFLNFADFLIDKFEEIDDFKLKHFYLNSLLIVLKCCSDNQNANALISLNFKLNDFLVNKLTSFVFKLLDCKLLKQVYFKLELKKPKDENSDKAEKYFLDEKLIKLVYLICEELFKIFSQFRCLKPTLVSFTFKLCSSDNQYYVLNCINHLLKNHHLLLKLFLLTNKNDILIDTSIVTLLLDFNKKPCLSNSKLASQSVLNVNCLIESFSRLFNEFSFPSHILSYKKLNPELDELNLEKTRSVDNFDNFEKFKNKLDNLLRSDSDLSDDVSLHNENKNCESNQNYESSSNDESVQSNQSLDKDNKELERENAVKFVQFLKEQIISLIRIKNIIKVDEAILRLSSSFCDQIKSNDCIINADGIYVSFYCSLSLNYQLFYGCNHSNKCFNRTCDRKNCDKICDKSNQIKCEEQFIEEIHKSGFIVFLSTIFIKELYQSLLRINLFQDLIDDHSRSNDLVNMPPLVKLILDLDNQSTFELIDYHKFNLNNNLSQPCSVEQKTKKEICKLNLMNELFNSIWPYILSNLSFILRKDFKTIDHKLGQDVHQLNLDLIFKTLNLSEQLIQLVYELNQTEKCLEIFDLFFSTILSDLDEMNYDKPINLFQITAILIIFKYSIQLSCSCPLLWEHVFSCSNFVSKLEYKHFTEKLNKNQSQNLQKYRKILKNLPINLSKKLNKASDSRRDEKNLIDFNNLNNLNRSDSNSSINLIDYDLFNDYSIDCIDYDIERLELNSKKNEPPVQNNKADDNHIDKVIENNLKESKLIVNHDDFELIINHLSKQMIKIFEDSALKLNLKYLLQFLDHLKTNSSRQLYSITNSSGKHKNKYHNFNCLLFDRFCDVIIKVFKSSRPVYHLIKSLNLASEHLIETASFEFSDKVRKTSISTINDLISNFISVHSELEHFHFNESLFKPYETLLLLELCEIGIQEMIISSICGFVEGYSNEIGSGWKALFRALCGVRLDDSLIGNDKMIEQVDTITESKWSELVEQIECVRQMRVILDIFDSFLKIRNYNVFNQGAVDCLNCLFKMLKKDTKDLNLDKLRSKNSFINLNLLSLKCLQQFETTLKEFYSNEDLILYHRQKFYLANFKTKLIQVNHLELCLDEQDIDSTYLKQDSNKDKLILEDHYVYYHYLLGLSTSIECCLIEHQSKIIEIYLSSLSFLVHNSSNVELGFFVFNHIVLKCIQEWSEFIARKLENQKNESEFILNKIELSNYKHFCMIATNQIVDLLKCQGRDREKNLLIYQFFVLFIQLIIDDYNFMISILSISCIRHIFKESIRYLNKEQYSIVVLLFRNVNKKETLKSFEKLIDFFENKTTGTSNEIANINLVGKLINDQENSLGLEVELANQLLIQSYLKNQIEIVDSGHLTKLYTFEIENESFTITKLIKKLLFLELSLKEIGGLIISTLKKDYNIKQFTSFEFENSQLSDRQIESLNQLNLIGLIDDMHKVFDRLDKNDKIKFLLQKISMLKPLINFYQFNSVCFQLKFLTYLDRTSRHVCLENDKKASTNLVEATALDYTRFKIERRLMKIEELNYLHFINKSKKLDLDQKLAKLERIATENQIDLDLIKSKLNDSNKISNDNKLTKLNTINYTNEIDLDTECYLIIYNKLFDFLLSLQLDLDDSLFEETLTCFLPLNYLLLKTKNDLLVDKLYDWLVRFDSIVLEK